MSVWEFNAWRQRRLDEFELALDQFLNLDAPASLLEPMRYATLAGGKRMRPMLAIAASEAVSGLDTDRQNPALRQHVLRVAAAVECVHVYSLVHDDLPCMDDDEIRRGRPTAHVKFGEAQALLAADALQCLAFELLSADFGAHPEVQVQWCRALSRAAGAGGMCGGQAIDIAAVGVALNQVELERMHAQKTGALLRCALALGGHAARANQSQLTALDQFGKHIGLAFQVIDDVLDVTADAKVLGKTKGKDAANDKPTFVSLLGLEAAIAYAYALHSKALDVLDQSDLAETKALRALAEQIVVRTH